MSLARLVVTDVKTRLAVRSYLSKCRIIRSVPCEINSLSLYGFRVPDNEQNNQNGVQKIRVLKPASSTQNILYHNISCSLIEYCAQWSLFLFRLNMVGLSLALGKISFYRYRWWWATYILMQSLFFLAFSLYGTLSSFVASQDWPRRDKYVSWGIRHEGTQGVRCPVSQSIRWVLLQDIRLHVILFSQ